MDETDPSFRLDRDRLSVLTGAIVLALSISRFLDTPVQPVTAKILGSSAGFDLSAATLTPLLLGVLGVTAVESLVRSHPKARRGELGSTAIYWILPGSLALALASWLGVIDDLGFWTLAIIISAVMIPLSLAAEYLTVGSQDQPEISVQWGQRLLIYLVILILLTRIYDWRARTLLSGTAVLFITTLLSTRLYWMTLQDIGRAFLYGLVVGLLLGQLTWVINYWPLSTLQGGLLLFISFYVIFGLSEQYLNGNLNRQTLAEHLGLAALALILVALAIP